MTDDARARRIAELIAEIAAIERMESAIRQRLAEMKSQQK